MDNDKKTTILGLIKSIIILIGTLFAADKLAEFTGMAEVIIYAIGGVWSVVEAVLGFFTNKADKK